MRTICPLAAFVISSGIKVTPLAPHRSYHNRAGCHRRINDILLVAGCVSRNIGARNPHAARVDFRYRPASLALTIVGVERVGTGRPRAAYVAERP